MRKRWTRQILRYRRYGRILAPKIERERRGESPPTHLIPSILSASASAHHGGRRERSERKIDRLMA